MPVFSNFENKRIKRYKRPLTLKYFEWLYPFFLELENKNIVRKLCVALKIFTELYC
jgi:hypothetical protein